MSTPDEPTLDIARGDPARSEFLRAALEVLRESSGDDRFRMLVDDILDGHTSLREAATSDVFNREVAPLVEEGMRRYQDLSDDEREELAARGEEEFEVLRDDLSY
jgi:hypothetical protein